jgi:exopolyphosphatase/pppGpp-phosphohydrolase
MIKVHGLGQKERLLLKVAAILHDIGKYVSLRKHYVYSYRLIDSSDMLGFSEQEKKIMAIVARYHSKGTQVPEKQEEKFEVHSITAEDKSLSSYPAKKDKRIKTPSNMIEADIRRMYIDEEKDRKTIAEFYGVSEGKINNFLYLHDIKRKKAPKPDKQPEETERP